jgi:hypothetical protein
LRTGRCESAETIAVTRVIPAEGPSFGIAPGYGYECPLLKSSC